MLTWHIAHAEICYIEAEAILTMLLDCGVHLHSYLPSYQELVNYRRKHTLWSVCMPGLVQLLHGFSVSRQKCQLASRLILETAQAFCPGGVDAKVRPACAAIGEQQAQVQRYSSHPFTAYGHWSACDTDQASCARATLHSRPVAAAREVCAGSTHSRAVLDRRSHQQQPLSFGLPAAALLPSCTPPVPNPDEGFSDCESLSRIMTSLAMDWNTCRQRCMLAPAASLLGL